MSKYRNKPVVIDAIRWFKNGDHPKDNCPVFDWGMGEGQIVRYYRRPDVDGQSKCEHCGDIMHNHGWIDAPGHTVYPGDWIITNAQGEVYPYSADLFNDTYELLEVA